MIPAANDMSSTELRDYARRILQASAKDVETNQTASQLTTNPMGSRRIKKRIVRPHPTVSYEKQRPFAGPIGCRVPYAQSQRSQQAVMPLIQTACEETSGEILRFNESLD